MKIKQNLFVEENEKEEETNWRIAEKLKEKKKKKIVCGREWKGRRRKIMVGRKRIWKKKIEEK